MRKLLFIALITFTLHMPFCAAQDLTVHVIDMKTSQPFKNFPVHLVYQCDNGNKGRLINCKEKRVKTNVMGIAVFHSVSLVPYLLVYPASSNEFAPFASLELEYRVGSPQTSSNDPASINLNNQIGKITTLPTEVTFHIRLLTFREHLTQQWRQLWAD